MWSEAQSCDGCGIGYRPSSLGSSGGTLTGPLTLPWGTAAVVSLRFDAPGFNNYGWYTPDGGTWDFSYGGGVNFRLNSNVNIPNDTAQFKMGTAGDLVLVRDAANTLARKNGNADQFNRLYGANGGYWEQGVNSELLTIAAAATTDTTGNLLPANAVIEAVVVRVTTVIPTAATFTVGDATTAARFATGVAVAADTTAVGLSHRQPDVAAAAGPVQTTAAKVRITPNSSPAAATGVVRIEVFFSRFVPPTS